MTSQPPTKGSTPAPQSDRPLPPHLVNNFNKTAPSTPAPNSGKATPKEPTSAIDEKANGAGTPPGSLDKAEKDRLKRERKKEKKERERADREAAKDKDGGDGEQKSGKATPTSPLSEGAPKSAVDRAEAVSSPVDSNGTRTPTSRKSHRNPWTLFVRMPNPANEIELRDFFGEASSGVRTTFLYPGVY